MKNSDTVNLKGVARGTETHIGKWKAEKIDAHGNAFEDTDFFNAITDTWTEYNRIHNEYLSGEYMTERVWPLIPGAIAIYDDSTPVNVAAGANPTGTLMGFIDLTNTNPDPANALEGFRLTAEFKHERIDSKTVKLTYKGEFPSGTAAGFSNKIRVFGAPYGVAREFGARVASNNALFGFKPDTLKGIGSGVIGPTNWGDASANYYVPNAKVTWPDLTLNSDTDGIWYGRARWTLWNAAIDRTSYRTEEDWGAVPEINIMPILNSEYVHLPQVDSYRIEAEPIAKFRLPAVTDPLTYRGSCGAFNGLDWLCVSRQAGEIVVDYYTEATGYTHSQHRIAIPKPAIFVNDPTVITIGVKKGKLYIAESARVNSSSKDYQVMYFHHVNLSDWSLEIMSRECKYGDVELNYPLETASSTRAAYAQTAVIYDEASDGYFFHGVYGITTVKTANTQGWIWFANKPVLTAAAADFIGMGESLNGTVYVANAEIQNTYWYDRAKYSRSAPVARTSRFRIAAITSGGAIAYEDAYFSIPMFDNDRICTIGNLYGNAHIAPLTLFKSSIIAEAEMPEVTKTTTFGLRLTYELTITEE